MFGSSHKLFTIQLALCVLILLFLTPDLATAQTTTTYQYDGQGRVVFVTRSDGASQTITFDDAHNITGISSSSTGGGSGSGGSGGGGAGGSGSNTTPTCSDTYVFSFTSMNSYDGLANCTDANGDTLTVTAVTDPPGATTANINNNNINFSNMYCGSNAVTRTVSDGNGGVTTSVFTVEYNCGGWQWY